MMKEKLLQRVDQLIQMGNAVLCTRHRSSELVPIDYVDDGLMKCFRSASLSFIRQVYGEQHPHYVELDGNTRQCHPEDAKQGLGILRAIQGEIAGDWLFTIKGLVAAEVFTDYVEMAEYLLQEQYKDAAAVIAGSTLEEHLRQLCRNNGIPVTQKKNGKDVPLMGGSLNDELAKKGVYNTNQQKVINGWLGIRNSAAHGKYNEYTPEQVKGMIAGITEFMARVAV